MVVANATTYGTLEAPTEESLMTEHTQTQDISPQPDVEYMTVEQAAELLQVPVSWVYRQTRRNAFPGMRRLGKYVRIRRSELLAWLDTQGRCPRVDNSRLT
jgi:excisionase family DNA binding protein